MSVGQSYALDVKQTTADSGGIGAAFNANDMDSMVIQLANGGGTGSVQFEGTIDGTNWFTVGAVVTTSGAFNVPFNKLKSLRARTTVNVAGGTYSAAVGGFMRGE